MARARQSLAFWDLGFPSDGLADTDSAGPARNTPQQSYSHGLMLYLRKFQLYKSAKVWTKSSSWVSFYLVPWCFVFTDTQVFDALSNSAVVRGVRSSQGENTSKLGEASEKLTRKGLLVK